MPKLYDLQELVEQTRLPERTVRYYLAKVLEAPGGTRGRKAFYTQETLDQLKLAKQVLMRDYDPKRGEVKPSLKDFQRWLQSHSAKDISTMVEMPYHIKPKTFVAEPGSQVSQLRNEEPTEYSIDHSQAISRSSGKEDYKKTTDSAAQYLDRVMGTPQSASPDPDNRHRRPIPWQSFQFGDDLEIKIRKQLTPAQKQQLALAGQLLQSMLEKE